MEPRKQGSEAQIPRRDESETIIPARDPKQCGGEYKDNVFIMLIYVDDGVN